MTLSALKLLSKNITYIDLLKGTFTVDDAMGLHPNPYDLKCLTNFSVVL